MRITYYLYLSFIYITYYFILSSSSPVKVFLACYKATGNGLDELKKRTWVGRGTGVIRHACKSAVMIKEDGIKIWDCKIWEKDQYLEINRTQKWSYDSLSDRDVPTLNKTPRLQ